MTRIYERLELKRSSKMVENHNFKENLFLADLFQLGDLTSFLDKYDFFYAADEITAKGCIGIYQA